MKTLDLAGTWRLRAEFIDVGPERFAEVAGRPKGKFSFIHGVKRRFPAKQGFIQAQVPCDVITPLMENNLLEELLDKKNTDDCLWICDYSWWFLREFEVDKELLNCEEVRLYIEILDYKADIIINNMPVASHKNAFRPLDIDVKRYLREGSNQIIIRLTSGFEDHYPNDSISYYCANGNGIADQRVYLRKPAYSMGWDWCKPVPTCGIGRKIELRGVSGAHITGFRADTVSIHDNKADIELYFEITNLSICSADDAVLWYEICDANGRVICERKDLYLAGGINFITEYKTIEKAKLWWPNGYGPQNLYIARAGVICRGHENEMQPKTVGLRTLVLRQDKLPDGSREFRFIVNGVPIFCKGGNWVPADSVYLRIPLSTYRTLVDEAAYMNSNMLRIWGGGLYEPDEFYDYCSQKGILVMHDFMYACAYYPDHLPWFVHEARLEAEYQVKRLAHHCCIAVWTGNNEVHESYTDWFDEHQQADYYFGSRLFNYIFPEIVRNHAPRVPYMPSSPFFGDRANSLYAGDTHVWNHMLKDSEIGMKNAADLYAFDRLAAKVRFSSEYGFHGPLVRSSVERYHCGEPVSMDGEIWRHHGEHHKKHEHIVERIRVHLADEAKLHDLDGYLLYGGIVQGLMYADMALALRRFEHCSGCLIWMYNDCWPETGWTPIDYYLTRKISYYFLKRAFEPRKLILRAEQRTAVVTVINETPEDLKAELEYGFFTFKGDMQSIGLWSVDMAAHSRMQFEFPAKDMGFDGAYYVRQIDGDFFGVATSIRGYYRDISVENAGLKIEKMEQIGNELLVTVSSKTYCPLVYLRCPDDTVRFDDNFFEMLPGQRKKVRVFDCVGDLEVQAVPIDNR